MPRVKYQDFYALFKHVQKYCRFLATTIRLAPRKIIEGTVGAPADSNYELVILYSLGDVLFTTH